MAFDACMLRTVLAEFVREFPEAKIEKIYQPQNDEIDLLIHYGKNSRRLVFNVGANAPRLQLSDVVKENPKVAPVFCMQLRKHLVGAKIVAVSQPRFDRIAFFELATYDEMGFQSKKRLVCEIMGKYANLILTEENGRIITALKFVDFAASSVRQILAGLTYRLPEGQDKLSPLDADEGVFLARLAEFSAGRSVEKFITATFAGIATRTARELAFRASGVHDVTVGEVDGARLYKTFSEWQSALKAERLVPCAAIAADGKPLDYSYMRLSHLGGGFSHREFPSFRELFDFYFAEKDRAERIHQRAHDVERLLSATVARTERKLAAQREALAESAKGEEYKRAGDLITANLFRLKRGMEAFRTVDYYSEDGGEREIKLDPRLSPAQNAQKMYKLYNKCKNAKAILTEQIALWERELVYLESVSAFLEAAECEEDILDIREELYSSGYAARMRGYVPAKKRKPRHGEFKTSGGYTVLVGRNNMQNDHLSHRVADKRDVWFHAKNVAGSHVILVTEGKEPAERDYTEAAEIAAFFSKAGGDRVAVDYTLVKNLKKPQGAKPGFVTYKTNYTAYVEPKDPRPAR